MTVQLLRDLDDIIATGQLDENMTDNLHHAEYPFAYIVDGQVRVIGDAEYNRHYCHIHNLWSIEKRKGYATDFLRYLFTQEHIQCIEGESTPNAVPFWFAIGATFPESLFNEFIESENFEDLLPFSLYPFHD